MTQNFDRTQGYFEGSRQVHLPDVYPPFLFREVHANHGVVACEGSMFKSKFANALTTMMIGSLGLASAENKLSVAYAGDAGHMDDLIEWMCARYTRESLVITRSLESQQLLSGLGVPNELGADTAWTFEPRPPDYARSTLRKAGWDEKTPILVLCPIHPFVWPVRASVAKYIAAATTGAYKDSQYRTVYFFESGAEVDRKFNHYVAGYAQAAKAFLQRHKVFPILVAMERLDAVACRAIEKEIPGTPIFTSDDYDMFELVSILRACSYMVSSRYHGIVTCMPAGVVSAGVTMDERIRNLMRERGHQHLLLNVDDPDLGPKLLDVMEKLVREAESVRDSIGRTVVSQSESHVAHGHFLRRRSSQNVSGIPAAQGRAQLGRQFAAVSATLRKLVEGYDSSAVSRHSWPAASLNVPSVCFACFTRAISDAMPNFLENTFAQLAAGSGRVVLREIRGDEVRQRLRRGTSRSGRGAYAPIFAVPACSPVIVVRLLAPNSIRWAAIDLALMAEGLVVVPLYSRQAPAELATMMKDCTPRCCFASDACPRGSCDASLERRPEAASPRPVRRNSAKARIAHKELPIFPIPARRRPRHHHLHLRNLRRTQGRLPQHEKSRPHAFLHHQLDRSARQNHEPDRVFQYLLSISPHPGSS